MRRAEVTVLTILYVIVTTIAGAFIEKEYGITIAIEKSFDSNNTKQYKEIIITDR